MTIPNIAPLPANATAEQVPAAMDLAGIDWTPIAQAPWAKDYPYQPTVAVRAAHTGDALLLNYRVEENDVRAVEGDNGRVWEDSCCEFFLRPQCQRLDYYNIECNASGHMLIGYHLMDEQGHETKSMRAEAAILGYVRRWSSLGAEAFDTQSSNGKPWQLALIVPLCALWQTPIQGFNGMQAKGNFYKCGDRLPHPHFLSWIPLQNPTPKFHLPQQFAEVLFE